FVDPIGSSDVELPIGMEDVSGLSDALAGKADLGSLAQVAFTGHYDDLIGAPSGGGGGDGIAAVPGCWVLSADTPAAIRDALTGLPNVFVCDGTDDQVEINAAIDYAAPLYARNEHSGVQDVSTQM